MKNFIDNEFHERENYCGSKFPGGLCWSWKINCNGPIVLF